VFSGFDADNLYRFRLSSVLAQVIHSTVLAVGFAPLADRVFDRYGKPSQAGHRHDGLSSPARRGSRVT
jgi:hypothetical protein